MEKIKNENPKVGSGYLGAVDKPVFLGVGLVITVVVIFTFISPVGMLAGLKSTQNWITSRFGWLYMAAVTIFLFISVILAFGPYGKMVLGKADDKPEFSFFAWVSMLISCGVGVGYAFWPVGESLWHYYNTPYLAESATPAAKSVAVSISMLHWGFHTWSIYALVGLAIAVPAYRLGKPMNISISLHGLLGDRAHSKLIGRIVEFISILAIIAGVSTGLGLGIIVLNGGLSFIFGWKLGNIPLSIMLFILIFTYMLAALSGVGKGIKFLAEINTYVALSWGLFLLLAGPTVYMLGGMMQSFGTYLNNFFYMSFWTDYDGQKGQWLGNWTVFYWLWWISWAPFTGGFLARISRGRTVKQFVVGAVIFPSLFSAAWFGFLGSGSQYVELNGLTNLWEIIQNDAGQGIFAVASAFGGGSVINLLILLSMFIFLATTADAASYFVAMQMSGGSWQPKSLMILICGGLMGALAITLWLCGGLQALQVASVVAGALFIIIMIAMVVSLFKTLKNIATGLSTS